MIHLSTYISNGPFALTTGIKTIEKDGGTLKYGPVIQGSVKIEGSKTTITFNKPYPVASKRTWLGRIATNVLTVEIDGSMIVASTSIGKQLKYELREIE